jgi:hypothetical protein
MNDGGVARKDRGGALEERQRRQRLEVRRITIKVGVVRGWRHGSLVGPSPSSVANPVVPDQLALSPLAGRAPGAFPYPDTMPITPLRISSAEITNISQ